MTNPIRFLAFLLIQTAVLPITITGILLFAIKYLLESRGKSVSRTAYEPFLTRWFLHALGKREDKAAQQLLYNLPGGSPITVSMAFGVTAWAMRLTGITINKYNYPVYSSSSLFDALGHRTRFFDEMMLRSLDQVEQIVILGAGWGTRGYGLAKKENINIFEVDALDTQSQKRKSLAEANIDSSHVIFATADFNKESWLDALQKVGFDPEKTTFILWEGVTFYLEAETVAATLQTVATQLAKGSAIAFDYPAKHIIEGDTSSRIYRYALTKLKRIDEPWTFGISTVFPAKEKLRVFLEQNGLTLAEYEAIGQGDEQQRIDGGLVLAVNNAAG